MSKHGHCNGGIASITYRSWRSMKARCSNRKLKSFKDYGGRGIIVCPRWNLSFEAFLLDMGERPSLQHSIDRFPDNDGNYEAGNCRWATKSQQQQNRRDKAPYPPHIRKRLAYAARHDRVANLDAPRQIRAGRSPAINESRDL